MREQEMGMCVMHIRNRRLRNLMESIIPQLDIRYFLKKCCTATIYLHIRICVSVFQQSATSSLQFASSIQNLDFVKIIGKSPIQFFSCSEPLKKFALQINIHILIINRRRADLKKGCRIRIAELRLENWYCGPAKLDFRNSQPDPNLDPLGPSCGSVGIRI
jgi:hypothetical protein